MLSEAELERATRAGTETADAIVRSEIPGLIRAARADRPFQGYLIAEGDSWFQYPLHAEIVDHLERSFGYAVLNAARWGDTAENIAYTEGGKGSTLVAPFQTLAARRRLPRAILLSCGGNDLTGEEFTACLNHARSGSPGLNADVVRGLLHRTEMAIATTVALLQRLSHQHFGTDVPILLHGYGNPVPDGRGFLGGAWILQGPWLAPVFEQKGYADDPQGMERRCALMRELVESLNQLLSALAPRLRHVWYLDVRQVLSGALPSDYRRSWANELHPTSDGFLAIAELFDKAIQQWPAPVSALSEPRPDWSYVLTEVVQTSWLSRSELEAADGSPGPATEMQPESASASDQGPSIAITEPLDGSTVRAPIAIVVGFQAAQAPVALDSLKIEVGRGIFWKNVTKMVREYVAQTPGATLNDQGLSVPAAPIPTGSFNIRIALGDTEGRETRRKISVKIT